MDTLTFVLDQVNRFLLRKQHLSPPARQTQVQDTVEDVGGLHATGATTTYLSLWARQRGFAKKDLQTALYEERCLARVLCMRDTLFILPKGLLPVAYQATKKRRDAVIDRYLRHYRLAREEYEAHCVTVKDLLGTSAKTAAEIKAMLPDSQLHMVVDLMPNDWQLARGRPRGSWRSNLQEYGAFDVWFPDVDLNSLSTEEAQGRLLHHYLSSLGPATADDFAWWSGLTKAETRRALESQWRHLAEIEIEGLGTGYILLRDQLEDLARTTKYSDDTALLPSLDPYIMGYKNRTRFLDPSKYDRVFDRAGNALPTVWDGGQVKGVWVEDTKQRSLQVLLFEEPEEDLSARLEGEAQQLSRFLEHEPADIQIGLYPQDLYPQSPFSLGRKA